MWGWWFETPSPSLWRHCNEPVKLSGTGISQRLGVLRFIGIHKHGNYVQSRTAESLKLVFLIVKECREFVYNSQQKVHLYERCPGHWLILCLSIGFVLKAMTAPFSGYRLYGMPLNISHQSFAVWWFNYGTEKHSKGYLEMHGFHSHCVWA